MKVNLAENIKNLRKEKNVSQEKLADYLNISFQAQLSATDYFHKNRQHKERCKPKEQGVHSHQYSGTRSIFSGGD